MELPTKALLGVLAAACLSGCCAGPCGMATWAHPYATYVSYAPLTGPRGTYYQPVFPVVSTVPTGFWIPVAYAPVSAATSVASPVAVQGDHTQPHSPSSESVAAPLGTPSASAHP